MKLMDTAASTRTTKRMSAVKDSMGTLSGVVLALLLAFSSFLTLRTSDAPMAAAAVAGSPNVVEDSIEQSAESTTIRDGSDVDLTLNTIGSGEASFYGRRFAGRMTANGETFDPADMTAAHRTLPFGSRIRVTNIANGRSVIVRVNDRGPYAEGRLIDVSRGAAERLGMVQSGTAHVELELIS